MLESVTKQNLNDPNVVAASLAKILADAPKNSNPYEVATKYVSNLLEQRAPLTAVSIVDENQAPPVWLVIVSSIFMVAFLAQTITAGFCLRVLVRRGNSWIAKRSKTGIFILNTRTLCLVMSGLFSLCLTVDMIVFLLAIYDVTGADSRFMILSIEWLPCFLAGWIFLWGLGAGIFEASYEAGNSLVIKKSSKTFFNFLAIALPLIMTISQIVIFIVVQYQMVQAFNIGSSIEASLAAESLKYRPESFNVTSDILPQLFNLKRIVPHEKQVAKFLLLGRFMWIFWALLLFLFTVPLVTVHLRTLKEIIQQIAYDRNIKLDDLNQRHDNHWTAMEDVPFTGDRLSNHSVERQASLLLQARLKSERRANKASLAIFFSYLIVFLFLSIANRAIVGMDQYDAGANMAVTFLVVGKSLLAFLGLVVTLQFYHKLYKTSKVKFAEQSGSMFGVGMQFHQEVKMVIEEDYLRKMSLERRGSTKSTKSSKIQPDQLKEK